MISLLSVPPRVPQSKQIFQKNFNRLPTIRGLHVEQRLKHYPHIAFLVCRRKAKALDQYTLFCNNRSCVLCFHHLT